MILPSDDEEEALSATKKPTNSVFKDVPGVFPSKFTFQLDHLDIHYKTTTDSPVSSDAEETVHSSSTTPITRPDIPGPFSLLVAPLVHTHKLLAQLQIILKDQPHLDQLDRYFNNLGEALIQKENQEPGQDKAAKNKEILSPVPAPGVQYPHSSGL